MTRHLGNDYGVNLQLLTVQDRKHGLHQLLQDVHVFIQGCIHEGGAHTKGGTQGFPPSV